VTLYLDTPTPGLPIHYTIFYGATMTIKGSLQVNIAIVEAFLTRNLRSAVNNLSIICVIWGKWGRNVKFCFWAPKTPARNDVSK